MNSSFLNPAREAMSLMQAYNHSIKTWPPTITPNFNNV